MEKHKPTIPAVIKQENGISTLPQNLKTVLTGDIARFEKSLTPVAAFNAGSMASMVKSHRNEILTAIELLIMKLAMGVNVGKNIEPFQAPDIAESIYKKYYKFSIEEVALVLKKGRAGEFGKLYDRLDEAIVLGWFEEYDCSAERETLVKNHRIEQEKLQKQESNAIALLVNSPNIARLMKQLAHENKVQEEREDRFKKFREEYLKKKQDGTNH